MPVRLPSGYRAATLLLACAFASACAPEAPAVGAAHSDPEAAASRTANSTGTTDDALQALTADSARILDELRELSSDSMEGRGTGTPAAARARAFLSERFASAGLTPLGSGWEHPFPWQYRGKDMTGVNLVGNRPGDPSLERIIVVSAHYDHEGIRNGEIYNGADDDASGSVALLALARALNGVAVRHRLVFVAFDAEEEGLEGSRAFVAHPPISLDQTDLDLNMDMVARTGGVLWAGGAHHTPALRPILEEVAARAPLTLKLGHDAPGAPEGDDWTHSSDHGPFLDAGIPFVYLGVEDHPDYHRPTDDFERIDPGEYMNALRTALMTLLALDQALPLSPAPSP